MKTPILGSSYVARSVNAADNRMVNLYPEATPEGGKDAGFLNRCPGLRRLATVGDGPIRGLWTFGNYGYVVSAKELYKIDSAWNATLIGAVSGSGPVSMSDNGFQLFVACNPKGYIYNARTNAFAEIIDPDFPGAVTVSYLDGYFVFNEPNSQKIWITELLEGTSVEPLDFASAEGSPDQLVSLIVDHREVWLFGSNSVEVWYDSGDVDFPLTRIQGAFNEIGCIAPYSVAKLDNGLFWLGADARGRGVVYRANGYTGQRVSTHAVEWQIQQYARLEDAIGYTYQQDGHPFYVLIFPDADTTWVYDVATGSWHERAGFVQGKFTRHRSNCQMSFGGEIVVGDYANGNLYAFDLNTYDDDGQPQRWLRSWRALSSGQNDLKRAAHHTLQLDIETGAEPRYQPTTASVSASFSLTLALGSVTVNVPTVCVQNFSVYAASAEVNSAASSAMLGYTVNDPSTNPAVGTTTTQFFASAEEFIANDLNWDQSNTFVAGGYTTGASISASLRVSTNGGTTWTAKSISGVSTDYVVAKVFYSATHGYWYAATNSTFGGDPRLFRTTDFSSWTELTSAYDTALNSVPRIGNPRVFDYWVEGARIYLVGDNLAYSDNGGTSWTAVALPSGDSVYWQYFTHANNIYWVTRGAGNNTSSMYWSTNLSSWTQKSVGSATFLPGKVAYDVASGKWLCVNGSTNPTYDLVGIISNATLLAGGNWSSTSTALGMALTNVYYVTGGENNCGICVAAARVDSGATALKLYRLVPSVSSNVVTVTKLAQSATVSVIGSQVSQSALAGQLLGK